MENTTTQLPTVESTEAIAKAAICMFVLVVSLIENILVLVVINKYSTQRMRTANNFFIANMSVADVLFALQNIPHSYNYIVLNGRWVLQGKVGMIWCKIDIFFSLIAMVTSNLTILAIAAYRLFVVYFPHKKIATRRVCFFVIFTTWLIPTLFASPMLYYADLISVEDFKICSIIDEQVLKTWYAVLAGVLAITLVAMLTLYTAIGVKLWRQKLPGDVAGGQAAQLRRAKRNRDIFKMLITLIMAFYVCSLPILVLQLSIVFGFYEVLEVNHGRFVCLLMLFLNGAINPIIYLTFDKRFGTGFKVFLSKCRCSRTVVYSLRKR